MKHYSFSSQLCRLIAAALLSVSSWAGAAFIAPTDNAPFRRDQLPIDVDQMKQLSYQLTVLCATLDVKDPEQQRAAAQLLALAQSLDPVNRKIEDLIDLFSKESIPGRPNSGDFDSAKANAWRARSWLASDESGKDGKAFALCLIDALAKVDPLHPTAAAHKQELGSWNGWVAPPQEFNKKAEPQIAENHEEPEEEVAPQTPQEEEKEEEKPDGHPVAFALKTATVNTPLWIYKEETRDYELKLVPVTMSNRIDGEYEDFRYHLKGVDEERIREHLVSINKATVPWLKQKFNGLPRGGVVELSCPGNGIYSIRRNGESISAAAAVLAHAAVSGQEATGIVAGIVQSDGKLTMPKNAWEIIQTITKSPPSRIVLPKSAAETLTTLLVMNDLAFFMKHDIFFADNIDELIALSKKTPDAAIAATLSNFASIREKSTSSIGPFVTNPHVRGRLETIVAATPNYASAQFLLTQAQGKRPSLLTEKMLAHQIRAALQPLGEIARLYKEGEGYDIKSSTLLSAHDFSRAALDPLDRMIASADRPLYGEALELSNTARTLARAVKKLAENNYEDSSRDFQDKSLRESIHSLTNGIPEMERKIARILGEREPEKRQ
jgi:hypothetical protein